MARKVLENEEILSILESLSKVNKIVSSRVEEIDETKVGFNDACYLSDRLSDIIIDTITLYSINLISDFLE